MDSINRSQIDSYLKTRTLLLAEATEAVRYYKNIVAYQESEGERTWGIGLYLAIQWVRYLKEATPDLEELRWFAKALEAEKDQEGIQCHYIWCRANELVEYLQTTGNRKLSGDTKISNVAECGRR